MQKTTDIFRAQNIWVSSVYFAFRVPQVRSPGKHYHTLLIAADLSNNPSLDDAIIQTRKLLLEDEATLETSIEVIDSQVVHGLYSFAISPTEEHLLEVWNQVYDEVLSVMNNHNETWVTVEMLHHGVEEDVKNVQQL
jgi:hypothetical protein